MNTKWSVMAFLFIVAGCGSGHGPDSLFNHKPHSHGTVSMCTQCHSSANSPSLDPLVTNGSGTFGKHIKHVQERGIDCEQCHYNYLTAPTHMNGVFDTGNPAASLVNMNIVGPAGLWTNDTGTGTGSCAGVACHGNATLDWYGTNTWALPACTTCHVSSFSSALDPTVANGTPPDGWHLKHVQERGIDCERCHYNYPSALTHANGVLDTDNPDVSLVRFNIVGSGGSWTNDTGAKTGDCASVSCHASNTLGWYGTGTWTLPGDCKTCHSSSYMSVLDPLATNGTNTAGKHVKHVISRNISCERCHYNYSSALTHANGVLDTGNLAVNIVRFNIVGPAASWTGDTGAGTGDCATVSCHASNTLGWYGTGTWTLPPTCTICHSSSYSAALDPTVTNGTPPTGRHVKHVTSRNIGCERCHYNYPSALTHANGVLDTGNLAVNIVRFNIVGPAASWTGDTGAGTGDCATVSCHASNTLGWYGTGTWTLPPNCTTCHSSSYSSVLDPLVTNGTDTAGKHVNHVTNFYIACSKCHYNYPTKTSHANGSMDTPDPAVLLVYFDATNPTGMWTNDTGPETGTCSSLFCHGTENPAWYGLAGVSFPTCAACHSGPIGTRRQIFGAGGDFGKNTGIKSHHVSGGNDPTSTQCLICHDMSQHMSGTVRVKNADSGAAVAYNPALPSTLEPFCLSCHDGDGAMSTFATGGTPTSPFNDGSILGSPPYPYAMRIYTSWTSTNGHGPNGNHASGKKLTCLGTGQPGTGCHGSAGTVNAHGSVNQVLAAQAFKYDNNYMYAASDFALCFNCHASYPGFTKEDILGVKQGGILDWEYNMSPYGGRGPNGWAPPYTIPAVQTHFADHNETGSPYNDPSFWGDNMNLHWAHIGLMISDFRGTGVFSGINCVNCHDVHGSTTPYGALYDEIGYSHVFPDSTNILGKMTDNAYILNQLDYHPTYCAGFNCHPVQGPTRAWFYPIQE